MPLRVLLLVVLAALMTACGSPRGDKGLGEACGDAEECRHGLCVGGVAGDDPVCTRSCASSTECPRGWSCSGVTGDNVLVCTRGAPTPFGIGANE